MKGSQIALSGAAALAIGAAVHFLVGGRWVPNPSVTDAQPEAGAVLSNRGTSVRQPPSASGHFEEILRSAESQRDVISRRAEVRRLHDTLLQLPAGVAVGEIRALLSTGRDVVTGEPLKPGSNGALRSAPSLRVMLLDILGRLDAKVASRDAARLLEIPTSADEWAISLRNYAWGTDATGARAYLQRKALELIQNPAWKAQPSTGYFEAFDVLVHTRSTEAIPILAGMTIDRSRTDLGYAAFLTLDRLAMREPTATLTALSDQTELASQRPQMLAGLFARADVRNPAQRAAVEKYLLAAERTDEEWAAFAGVFPNANALVSENLLTSASETAPLSPAEHDREALSWVRAMSKDPRFQSRVVQLRRIEARLAHFAEGRGQ